MLVSGLNGFTCWLQVIVKDFVSQAVISQFRAHTSPISALCFDPSGTLLVTASVHGNNINIFRIIPSRMHTGSGNQTHDWSSAHVHLYKLHRGITTAVSSHLAQSNCYYPFCWIVTYGFIFLSLFFFCF